MTVVVRPDILSSLKSVREDVQRQVVELDHYRALKAIEQTIADFPSLEDIARSLSDIRDKVQRQLDDTREYRALRTLERIVPELSDVLDLVAERAGAVDPGKAEEGKADLERPAATEQDAQVVPGQATNRAAETEASAAPAGEMSEDVMFVGVTAPNSEERDDADPLTASEPGAPLDDDNPITLSESEAQRPPLEERAPAEPAPSLAYSLAQMMVQAMVPPPAGPLSITETAESEKGEAPAAGEAIEPSLQEAAGRAA